MSEDPTFSFRKDAPLQGDLVSRSSANARSAVPQRTPSAGVHGGSWVVISGGISRVTIVITHIKGGPFKPHL